MCWVIFWQTSWLIFFFRTHKKLLLIFLTDVLVKHRTWRFLVWCFAWLMKIRKLILAVAPVTDGARDWRNKNVRKTHSQTCVHIALLPPLSSNHLHSSSGLSSSPLKLTRIAGQRVQLDFPAGWCASQECFGRSCCCFANLVVLCIILCSANETTIRFSRQRKGWVFLFKANGRDTRQEKLPPLLLLPSFAEGYVIECRLSK